MSQNDDLYLDQIKKIAHYRQLIVDDYLKKGKVIDKTVLENKIDEIDTKLAIFRQSYIKNGSVMDIATFNQQKDDIYKDLCILYETLYELAEKKLAAVERKIDCNLQELTEKAKRYKNRTKLETLAIYGDSIYYKTNNFSQEYKDGNIVIDLGAMDIPSGSYLACLFNCDEAVLDDVKFIFKNTDKEYQITDYMYNKQYLKILGNYKTYTEDIVSDENKKAMFKIEHGSVDNNSKYNLFAGKDMIAVKHSEGGTEYVEKSAGIPYTAEDNCEITFYVYDSSKVNIDIIEENLYENRNIDTPKFRQMVRISCKKGTVVDFTTDGKVFADKVTCIVSGEDLYCPNAYSGISRYMLEEVAYGDDVHFDSVSVVYKTRTTAFVDVNYIAIKQCQISELENE